MPGILLQMKLCYRSGDRYPEEVSRSRRRQAMLGRLAILVILALIFCLRPTLSAMGEAHEMAVHDPSGQHVLFDHGQAEESRQDGGVPAEGEGGSALHVLAHFAHCCGQGSLVVSPIADVAIAPLHAFAPTPPFDAPLPRVRWQTPFRPPIVT